ncbi:hypothetical protein CHH91_17750 [Virgibacillus sp. 7505]|nr:hypothetical protein CHH91_17750 [Virgibacillus sp. 7505]
MGEFERMKEFSMKVTADDYAKMGWDGFINQANDRFSGGADALSQTARAFRQMGDGILTGMMPQLDAIVGWIDNNQDKWKEWKETIVSVATDISTPLFQGLADGFNYLRENYLENEDFRNLDFEGKVKFILDDVKSWWNDTAKPKVESWWQSTGEPGQLIPPNDGWLWTYKSANWNDKRVKVKPGEAFTITRELRVNGSKMYQIKSGLYITASAKYVKV